MAKSADEASSPLLLERFTLLSRYPDMGHLLYQGLMDLSMDIFLYLDGRKDGCSQL